MERTLARDIPQNENKEITLKGWIDVRRDHGKLIFIDLRDWTGISQIVFLPNNKELQKIADRLRTEWVVEIAGLVQKRPVGMENKNLENGAYEIVATNLVILNEAKTPPFEINADGHEINEEVRMQYRYLDLRRPRLQKNIRMRDAIISFFRTYMHKNDFVEIETPILMKGTPEGAREYLVPSRMYPGNFYALPQSPQQFKQLSMVAGFEKYFQIARCFRDEDTRGDRQPEFTQLDYEMSFVNQEDVLKFTEEMFVALVKELFPEKKISATPFPRLTYAESIKQYGSDKPDLRKDKNDPNELAFAWILDFPMFEKTDAGELQAMHHPFCSVKEEDKEKFMSGEDLFSIRANSYDLVLNGYELSSGSIRIHESAVQKKVFELLRISEEEQQRKFGHILEAFQYGAPPHGGFAPGIDRFVMILMNEPNIREVIAFPKTGDGRDLMMNAPSPMPEKQIDELHITVVKKEKNKK
jgi:aspartyl-tRNA synthetase